MDKRFKVVKDLIKVKQEKIESRRSATLSRKSGQPAKQRTKNVNKIRKSGSESP